MNASAGLCGWNPLYTMGAALVFHFAVGTASVNHENNLFKSAKVTLIHVHQLYTPTL
ncbi:hypothetical protein D3C75_1281780 [compost metagenome]